MNDAVAVKKSTELSPEEILFGASPGCWSIQSRYAELLLRLRGTDYLHRQLEEADDFINSVLILVLDRFSKGLIKPDAERSGYGFWRLDTTDTWKPIHDPLDHIERLVRERSRTVLKRIQRESARIQSLPEQGVPGKADSRSDVRHESVAIVRAFHAMPENRDCSELHRLHDIEAKKFVEILSLVGSSLGLASTSSLRSRYRDCKERLSQFVLRQFRGEAEYWSGN